MKSKIIAVMIVILLVAIMFGSIHAYFWYIENGTNGFLKIVSAFGLIFLLIVLGSGGYGFSEYLDDRIKEDK